MDLALPKIYMARCNWEHKIAFHDKPQCTCIFLYVYVYKLQVCACYDVRERQGLKRTFFSLKDCGYIYAIEPLVGCGGSDVCP